MVKYLNYILIFLWLSISATTHSQSDDESTGNDLIGNDTIRFELHGSVLNIDDQTPLPYANIYVMHKTKGTITNEKGHFTLNISGLEKTDTLRFQYIGYQTKSITLAEIDS